MPKSGAVRRGVLAVAGGIALVALLAVVAVLNRAEPVAAPLTSPTAPSDPAVAIVDDTPIGVNLWVETVLVDRVMSQLVGVVPPDPQVTLERMVNEMLIAQGMDVEQPDGPEVEAYIATLEAGWGVNDEQVVAALRGVGLERDALVRTAARLLLLQQAQEKGAAEGWDLGEWLTAQREQVQVVTDQEQVNAGLRALASILPPSPPPPTATSEPSSPQAADFRLRQAGGGRLTLSSQLAQGPVVLVFFQKCG